MKDNPEYIKALELAQTISALGGSSNIRTSLEQHKTPDTSFNNIDNQYKVGYTAGAWIFIISILIMTVVLIFVLSCEIFGRGIDKFIDSFEPGPDTSDEKVKVITIPTGPIKHLFPIHQ